MFQCRWNARAARPSARCRRERPAAAARETKDAPATVKGGAALQGRGAESRAKTSDPDRSRRADTWPTDRAWRLRYAPRCFRYSDLITVLAQSFGARRSMKRTAGFTRRGLGNDV